MTTVLNASDKFLNSEFLSKYEIFTTTLLVKSFGLGDAYLHQQARPRWLR